MKGVGRADILLYVKCRADAVPWERLRPNRSACAVYWKKHLLETGYLIVIIIKIDYGRANQALSVYTIRMLFYKGGYSRSGNSTFTMISNALILCATGGVVPTARPGPLKQFLKIHT